MKKILSVLLALTMVFGMLASTGIFASADDSIIEDPSSGIVTETPDDETSTDDNTDLPEDNEPSEDEPSEDEPSDTDPIEPVPPSQEEISNWFARIITMVLDFLARVCEILFEEVLW